MAEARYDLPLVEEDTRPWWDAVRTGRLLLETCSACAHVQFPVRGYCSRCWCEDIALTESAGRGTVYTYSTVRANALPPFNSRLPYNIAMVDLDEGPRLMTTILTDREPRIGDRVAFETVPLDDTLDAPVFRPITTAEKAEAHDRDH